jgi:hypothetical protein
MASLRDRPSPSLLLDWLMAIAGVLVVGGLYIDGHAHVYQPVETFFTTWHAMMYGGALFAALVFGAFVVNNMRHGFSLRNSVPEGYLQTLIAIPCVFIGGGLDVIWHYTFGIEQQLDTLVSPTHMVIISAMFFIFSGPLRAGIARQERGSLFTQLPMLISMAVTIGTVMFVTQMAFYPEALWIDHPLPVNAGAYSQDTLTVIVLTYYSHLLGTLAIIWQSLLLAATSLYLILNVPLRLGALLFYVVAQKALISVTISRSWTELLLWTIASIVAGLVAEFIYARYRPSRERPNAVRAFGFLVPLAFYAGYFAFAVPLFGGTWWDAAFLFGGIAYAGLAGLLVAQLMIGAFATRATAA